MLIVGLSGGIASGKSTCSRLLREQHGFTVIDCDDIAHQVVLKGRWGWRRLVKAFGTSILDAQGEVDRAKLGRIVFNNTSQRKRLNAATHLPVALELVKQLAWSWLRGRRMVIVDMPLLFETGTHVWTSPRVLVYVDRGTQVRRLIARDRLTPEEAVSRVQAQMPLEDKIRLADVLINNEGPVQQLEEQVTELAGVLRRKASWLHLVVSPAFLAATILGLTTVLKLRHV